MAGRNTTTIDLCSDISLPLESKESLHGLLLLMQNLLKHNFVAGMCNSYPLVLAMSCTDHHACFKNFAGVLSVASAIMALHYEEVLLMNNSCLIPFLFGETETGTVYL